ncbi:MAG: tetratricopeptide repeat protein [Balneolaceae bacterium]|nr:tetratricopeptide repeat protein [Balneolaceae bacterium]
MGLVYFEMEEHDKALEFYTEALAISKETGNKNSLAVNYNNIGLLHGDEGRFDLALKNHFKALKLRRELGYTIGIANSLNNIGRVIMQQGRYGEAIDYLRQAFRVNRGNDPELTTIIHENLAKTYRSAGQLDSALVHARKTVELSEAFGTKLGVKVGYELLTEIYKKRGRFEKALASQQHLMAVEDSILNAEKAKQISELQTRYETEKKEKEIALLEKERQREALLRNAFLAGLVLVGIIGFLVYNRQRLKIRKNRAELENRRLKEQQLQKDLEFRNRQLTTHTLHLVQKNGTMLELKEKIGELRQADNGESMSINRALQKLEHLVDYSFHLDEDWKQFRLCFEEVHPGFFDELREEYPELTPNELRLAALARLNLSVKETAAVMGITPDSVKTARYRLRKKMELETEENLTEVMMEVGE